MWFISGDPKLSSQFQDSIRDPENEVYLSSISIWEVIIKHQLGKIPLPESPEKYLPKQRDLHQISALFLDESSVIQLARLLLLHRDPFDRMLICQALQNDLIFATVNQAILAYSIDTL